MGTHTGPNHPRLGKLKIALWGHTLDQHHTELKYQLKIVLLDRFKSSMGTNWINIILGRGTLNLS